MHNAFDTPWKIWNGIYRLICFPAARTLFLLNGIPVKKNWKLFGLPIIQKHRLSCIRIGENLNLRSFVRSNPLVPNHPVMLCTWESGAVIEIGSNFAMTGGAICAARKIVIGDNVIVGANSTIIDTDFHPLDPEARRLTPQKGTTAPITIEDDVFIGMNSLILKGVRIGRGSVIGAGSVVTKDVPPGVVVAGNPAQTIREL